MSLAVIIAVGIIVSVIFHFVGVKVEAKKSVWVVIVLFWAGSISIAMSEVKEKGYKDIEKMRGNDPQTDKLIEDAMPKVSVYELVTIKNSYNKHKKKS